MLTHEEQRKCDDGVNNRLETSLGPLGTVAHKIFGKGPVVYQILADERNKLVQQAAQELLTTKPHQSISPDHPLPQQEVLCVSGGQSGMQDAGAALDLELQPLTGLNSVPCAVVLSDPLDQVLIDVSLLQAAQSAALSHPDGTKRVE